MRCVGRLENVEGRQIVVECSALYACLWDLARRLEYKGKTKSTSIYNWIVPENNNPDYDNGVKSSELIVRIKDAAYRLIESLDPVKEHKAAWVTSDISRLIAETQSICSKVTRCVQLGLETDKYHTLMADASPFARYMEDTIIRAINNYWFHDNEDYYQQYCLYARLTEKAVGIELRNMEKRKSNQFVLDNFWQVILEMTNSELQRITETAI